MTILERIIVSFRTPADPGMPGIPAKTVCDDDDGGGGGGSGGGGGGPVTLPSKNSAGLPGGTRVRFLPNAGKSTDAGKVIVL